MMIPTALISYVTAAILLIVLALLDRIILRRGQVEIQSLEPQPPYMDKYCFSIRFHASGLLMYSRIEYHLRSKEDPTMVIVGKERTLAFAKSGLNHETLLFDKAYVQQGDWELCVSVVNQGSRINPFYMIFPQIQSKTYEVKL